MRGQTKWFSLLLLTLAVGMSLLTSCHTRHKCHDCPTFGKTMAKTAAKST